MFTAQVFIAPLVALVFASVLLKLKQEAQLSPLQARWGLGAVGVIFGLLCWNSWNGIRAIQAFRSLKPAAVQRILFYDESRHNYGCLLGRKPLPRDCVVLAIQDPALIRQVVATFPQTRAYAPNHEGAKNRYLMRLVLAQGKDLWLILGQGNRHQKETAWVEFNSHIGDGWHYGVYLDQPLYQVLKGLHLPKWQ